MVQEQGWQLVSAITASIAASSGRFGPKHLEKHGFASILLTYENSECWLQKEFDKADVLALPLIQKRPFYKRWNTIQTTLLQSQSSPQFLHKWIEQEKLESNWGPIAVLKMYWPEQNTHRKGCFSPHLSPTQEKGTLSGYPAVAFTAPATTILLPQSQINASPKAVTLCKFCHF